MNKLIAGMVPLSLALTTAGTVEREPAGLCGRPLDGLQPMRVSLGNNTKTSRWT